MLKISLEKDPSLPASTNNINFDLKQGLTSEEARHQLAIVGANELIIVRHSTALVQFLLLFLNPLVIILLTASLASALLGEAVNAIIIVAMVIVSVIINFIQTYRSQQAAERLRQQVVPTATVLRDGNWIELPRRELVPGDIIRLSAGDLVPADACLLQTKDLHVNEASLTGESLPVEKSVNSHLDPTAHSINEMENKIFLGTSVVSGTAMAQVIATGKATQFGDIVARLATRPPATEFERGTNQFGFLIMKTIFLLVFFVLIINIVMKHNPLESILFAIALAVGLTPEFLPMITTVTLGQGAVHMAREKVIVKHLSAIQNFGSIDILCSDKTGTLTSSDTILNKYIDPYGNSCEKVFLLSYLNSNFETGIKNPLDLAILQHHKVDIETYHKVDEIPFDFERRRLSIVVDNGNRHTLITKGAPENVLACCTNYELNDKCYSLDDKAHTDCQNTYQTLNEQGFRVLAVAYRHILDQQVYSIEDEKDLTLIGFLIFSNPLLADTGEMLKLLHQDGVEVKILTGDNELVTKHICSEVGINVDRIVLGDEIDHMSAAALAQIAEKVNVFARMSPAQKHRIIIALKSSGHVVGFLGDGINDAPSLHAADVGISVSTAVDVAKDAAEIILLEHSLRALHQGIIEGRKAFGNVMKYLLMGTSSNFGNMFSMAGASLFLPYLPMLPKQILLNNFMYDLAQVTIPTDNVDETYIHKPKRWNIDLIKKFMLYIGPISSIYDFLTFFVLLKIFQASEAQFHTGWFVESLATQTLVLFIIRTAGHPLYSRPSTPLTITIILIVLAGILLPFSPLASTFGFTPLPLSYFLFLIGMTSTYLILVEMVKHRLMRQI